MKRTKIVYIVSDIDKSLQFEWVLTDLAKRYELTVLLIINSKSQLESYLQSAGIPVVSCYYNSQASLLATWFKIAGKLVSLRPDVIHTHLWKANLIGLTAGFLTGVKKRIYTRHHAMIHYDEFPSGRKWDRLCNFLATDIVAISKNVASILIDRDRADERKVHVIHHGFDLEYFFFVDASRVSRLKTKLNLSGYPVIGMIARYIELKGIQFVIPAFKKLISEYPKAHLVLANANGNYVAEIKKLLATLPAESYTEIIFENDLAALYRLFDVFVNTPFNPDTEAFGQTYVEAMACGVPAVVTVSGVGKEFVSDGYNACVVDYKNSEAIYLGIRKILANESLRNALITNGKKSIKDFSLREMIRKLDDLYARI